MQIDVALVRGLVDAQFPEWSGLPIEPVPFDGHDNRTFHLGTEMSIRMPSGEWYAAHVRTEHEWLPVLGPSLPLPVPVPLGKGQPGPGYPWQWSINKWIPGESASIDRIADLPEFARDLARFLTSLQAIDATGAPPPGRDNFFRGGDLGVYDSETRECIDALRDVIDVGAVTSAWETALEASWTHPPVWVHGDVALGNLLVRAGRLCGVIDFGQLAGGDPSCDLTICWTLFSGPSRAAFRGTLEVDEATWTRARGWGIWKALLGLRGHRSANPEEFGEALRVLHEILTD